MKTIFDTPFFDWDEPRLRSTIPEHLVAALGLATPLLIVPLVVVRKVDETHPVDAPYLPLVEDLLESWRFAGAAPDRPGCFEVFGTLAGVWRTAVLGTNRSPDAIHLITFHRVDEIRVNSKRRRGYLLVREG